MAIQTTVIAGNRIGGAAALNDDGISTSHDRQTARCHRLPMTLTLIVTITLLANDVEIVLFPAGVDDPQQHRLANHGSRAKHHWSVRDAHA